MGNLKAISKAIGKKVDIKLKIEEFYVDIIGEGELSLDNFEKLLDKFEKACIKEGEEKIKLARRMGLEDKP